jgi:hypothetical protein
MLGLAVDSLQDLADRRAERRVAVTATQKPPLCKILFREAAPLALSVRRLNRRRCFLEQTPQQVLQYKLRHNAYTRNSRFTRTLLAKTYLLFLVVGYLGVMNVGGSFIAPLAKQRFSPLSS